MVTKRGGRFPTISDALTPLPRARRKNGRFQRREEPRVEPSDDTGSNGNAAAPPYLCANCSPSCVKSSKYPSKQCTLHGKCKRHCGACRDAAPTEVPAPAVVSPEQPRQPRAAKVRARVKVQSAIRSEVSALGSRKQSSGRANSTFPEPYASQIKQLLEEAGWDTKEAKPTAILNALKGLYDDGIPADMPSDKKIKSKVSSTKGSRKTALERAKCRALIG